MEYPVALVQGIYFFITGVWPLVSMRTFLTITGPKTDLWLVKTVGAILAVIGAVLILAQANGEINASIVVLAMGSAFALAIVEIIYVGKQVIPLIYLADAFAELLLIAWWAFSIVFT